MHEYSHDTYKVKWYGIITVQCAKVLNTPMTLKIDSYYTPNMNLHKI